MELPKKTSAPKGGMSANKKAALIAGGGILAAGALGGAGAKMYDNSRKKEDKGYDGDMVEKSPSLAKIALMKTGIGAGAGAAEGAVVGAGTGAIAGEKGERGKAAKRGALYGAGLGAVGGAATMHTGAPYLSDIGGVAGGLAGANKVKRESVVRKADEAKKAAADREALKTEIASEMKNKG